MKRYLALLLMGVLTFMACEQKEEPKAPVFTVTSEKEMTFDATGGNGTITYSIDNPSEDLSVNAVCDAEWVVNITEGTSVTFTVVENESTEARNTEITVSYGESFQKVSVSQNGKELDPVLTLTSEETMSYTCEGGEGKITYTLEYPKEGVNVTATCGQDWITDIAVGDEITFNVSENNMNEAREATIAVAYGKSGFNVTVTQEANPITTMTASVLSVQYYGNAFNEYYNYFVTLSDKGFDDNGYAHANGHYFQIDLYSTTPHESGDIRIPDGVYTFDANDAYNAGTFSASYSNMIFTDENANGEAVFFVGGTMTVTSEGIELVVENVNGEKYRVVYEGEPLIEQKDYYNSTLEGDYSVSSENGYFLSEAWGDYYENGKSNYLISIFTDSNASDGDMFSIEILSDNHDGITGTYSVIPSTDATNSNLGDVFIAGELGTYNGELYYFGSWLLSITEGIFDGTRIAPMASGEIVITEEAGVHTFTFNCYDYAGNKISASIKASGDMYDENGNLTPATKSSANRCSIRSNRGMKVSSKTKSLINL